jgi:import inner membrane translocase subunit TIM10
MSMFFGAKPQISSEQKIAQAEAEIDMVSDMYSRYVYSFPSSLISPL